jgi:uncharacterized repeat protein (TIGR01451 family)
LDSATDFTNADPVLDPLANNGGETATHELLYGSAALDTGRCDTPPGFPPSFPSVPDVDQRGLGFQRAGTGSTFCDIGAFELQDVEVDLAISKSAAPTTVVDPGDTITYTIVYTNQGTAKAVGVVITDIVPITLTNVTSDSSGTTLTPGTATYDWSVEDLISARGGVITITGEISSGLTAGGAFLNTATITTTGTDGQPDNNSNSASITISDGSGGVYLPIIMKLSSS